MLPMDQRPRIGHAMAAGIQLIVWMKGAPMVIEVRDSPGRRVALISAWLPQERDDIIEKVYYEFFEAAMLVDIEERLHQLPMCCPIFGHMFEQVLG